MKRILAAVNRTPLRILAVVCIAMAFIPPLVAYAGSTDYAVGTFGCCGYFPGPGFNTNYIYNQVWHSTNATWEVYYETTTPPYVAGDVQNNSNPTKWPNAIGYGKPWCHNVNDNTGVAWSCQYGT